MYTDAGFFFPCLYIAIFPFISAVHNLQHCVWPPLCWHWCSVNTASCLAKLSAFLAVQTLKITVLRCLLWTDNQDRTKIFSSLTWRNILLHWPALKCTLPLPLLPFAVEFFLSAVLFFCPHVHLLLPDLVLCWWQRCFRLCSKLRTAAWLP